MHCRICGKSLTDPVSISLEIGPVCAMKLKGQQAMGSRSLFASRASYTAEPDGNVIKIVDLDQGMSVTNDVENVIADLVESGYDVDQYILLYRDTDQVWDRIVTERGRFVGFTPVRETDYMAAKAKAAA